MAGYKLHTNITHKIEIEYAGFTNTFEVRPQTSAENFMVQTAAKKVGDKNWTTEKSIPFLVPLIVGWNIEDEFGKIASITLENLRQLPGGLLAALLEEISALGFLGVRPKTADSTE